MNTLSLAAQIKHTVSHEQSTHCSLTLFAECSQFAQCVVVHVFVSSVVALALVV